MPFRECMIEATFRGSTTPYMKEGLNRMETEPPNRDDANMKLFLVRRTDDCSGMAEIDHCESFVVSAPDLETARRTNPNGCELEKDQFPWWTRSLDDVEVIYLGEAVEGIGYQVINCSSYISGCAISSEPERNH